MSGFNTIDEILADLRQGRMAVIMDDEDRENEGDLIMPAACVRAEDARSWRLRFALPAPLARFAAPKGSICLDGVSLTVNEVDGNEFGVNIIPHTHQATTLGELRVGDGVNVEIDVIARYVARLLSA